MVLVLISVVATVIIVVDVLTFAFTLLQNGRVVEVISISPKNSCRSSNIRSNQKKEHFL